MVPTLGKPNKWFPTNGDDSWFKAFGRRNGFILE